MKNSNRSQNSFKKPVLEQIDEANFSIEQSKVEDSINDEARKPGLN